jgi:hypothetical protein
VNGFRVALCLPLFLLGNVATASTASAADEGGLGIAYDMRSPAGSFRGVVPDVGAAGVQLKWDYFPIDELSLGFDIQCNTFRRGPPALAANRVASLPSYRNLAFWSFLWTARHYLSTGALRPYAELGAGLSAATGATAEDLSRREVVAGFVVQPAVGLLMRFSEDDRVPFSSDAETEAHIRRIGSRRGPDDSLFGVTVSAAYSFTTVDIGGARDVGFVGFQLGIYAKP